MFWILPALAGALANAAYFITTKRLLATTDRNVLAAGVYSTAGMFLLVFALIRGIPLPGNDLFIAIAATSVLNIIATSLVFRSLSTTGLSLSVPMISFTPLFLIVTSFLLLGELPAMTGIAGICMLVAGSYILNISQAHTRLLDPFRAILHRPGSRSMVMVAFIYSVSLNFDKMVVANSDPVFGSAVVCLILGSSFLCIACMPPFHNRHGLVPASADPSTRADGNRKTDIVRSFPRIPRQDPVWVFIASAPAFTGIGIIVTVEAVMINYAFTLQIVPYVIAIKRMGIIITVLYGTMIAGEGEVLHRLAGAMFMVAGAILIILFG